MHHHGFGQFLHRKTTFMTSCCWSTKAFQNGLKSYRSELAPLGANVFLSELTPLKRKVQVKLVGFPYTVIQC